MLLNRVMVVITGFAFWIVAARFYDDEKVGLAVAMISAATMLVSFSILGFNVSMIRFFNSYDRPRILNTCLSIVIMASVILGIAYISSVHIISPGMSAIQQPVYAVIFLLFVIVYAIGTMTSQAFIAMRDAKYTFFQNLILVVRIPLLLPLAILGSFGMMGSILIASGTAYLIALYLLNRFVGIDFKVDTGFIKKSINFSLGNYFAGIFASVAYLALPIVILNVLGEAEVAKYYMAYTIGNFLMQIPEALSTSFFVEGVYGESLKRNIIRSAAAIYSLLIPCVVVFYFLGDVLLSLFGSSYVGALPLLRLISISSLFYVPYILFVPVLNIRMKTNVFTLLNFLLLILMLGSTYLLLPIFGINGIGYGIIIAYAVLDLAVIGLIKAWGWI
jgi:O-antigen/teichoic acid export membrane protein